MEFAKKNAIYLQIADVICEQIVLNHWHADEKIPSVRELAVSLQVNPNTIMKTYSKLESQGIINKVRGIGFYVDRHARKNILAMKKEVFIKEDLPQLFKKMAYLEISFDELKSYFGVYM